MRASKEGRQFITQLEGKRNKVYLDTGGVPTNGVGHTGPDVYMGMPDVTDELIDLNLTADLETAETAINKLVSVPLTQNQFDALVSFVFNVGTEAFKNSTMLRLLNAKDYEGASHQFGRWVKDNGKLVPGLVNRRRAEANLFDQ